MNLYLIMAAQLNRKQLLRTLSLLIQAAFLTLILSSNTLAESTDLPTVMVGQTTVTQSQIGIGSKVFYGGFQGNEAVYNSNPDYLYGFHNDTLVNCYDPSIRNEADPLNYFNISVSRCFQLERTQSIGLMTSRTYINSVPVTELATLFYPSKLIGGDVYGPMSDFATWGRNLSQSSNNSAANATWMLKNYTLNPDSQSAWKSGRDETAVYAENKAKIDNLMSEGTSIAVTASGDYCSNDLNLYAQSDLKNLNDTPTAEAYPEGKVWTLKRSVARDLYLATVCYDGSGNALVYKNMKYSGKGTIIIEDGDLHLGKPGLSSVFGERSLEPVTPDDRIGFIVNGDVHIYGQGKIQAAIFATGKIVIHSTANLDLVGSFVAYKFDIKSGAENIRFYYDYNLGSNWPPGFRYLNMPQAEER